MKRVGPDLKMPEMKVPKGVSDFYLDLRDRRLLPVIALVVVAIVAVPFLLGDSKEAEVPAATSEALAKTASAGSEKSELTVVRSNPGLRSYKKRLKGSPADPFKQKVTGQIATNAQLGEGGEEPTTVTTTTTESESGSVTITQSPESSPPESNPGTPPQNGDNKGNGQGNGHLTFFAWEIDVKITKQSGEASGSSNQDPSIRKNVMPQTPLPGPKAPVVTYMGASRKHPGQALLLVSNQVHSVFGETGCANKQDLCQLIEVEPGFPVTLVYGANEVRYVVNVLKLELVPIGHS
jgi:hypothetical protein